MSLWYNENGFRVFTALSHIKRGYCCGNSCRHCPYTKPHTKKNTIMAKKALYLDDVRTPITTLPDYEEWVVVRNYDEFVDWITKNGIPELISFDHDLANEHIVDYFRQRRIKGYQTPDYDSYYEKTGMDCAKWLINYAEENDLKINYVSVHSHNPVGAKNIQSLINQYKHHKGWESDCYIGQHPFKIEEEKKPQ